MRVSGPLIAQYGWRSREDRLGQPLIPLFTFDEGGWRWNAPVGGGRHAWVSLRFDGSARAGRSGVDVTWRLAWPCASDRYFLAGDAAFVLDPASSKGVMRAMMSGMVAANAIAEIASGRIDAGLAMRRYSAWARDCFISEAAALIALYSGVSPAVPWLASASGALRHIATYPLA